MGRVKVLLHFSEAPNHDETFYVGFCGGIEERIADKGRCQIRTESLLMDP